MAAKDNLKNIIERMEQIARELEEAAGGNDTIKSFSLQLHEAADELRREVFDRYDRIGKSSSERKRTASTENGRKGGRPPKAITELKKRLAQPDCENRAETEARLQELLAEWRGRADSR